MFKAKSLGEGREAKFCNEPPAERNFCSVKLDCIKKAVLSCSEAAVQSHPFSKIFQEILLLLELHVHCSEQPFYIKITQRCLLSNPIDFRTPRYYILVSPNL